MSSESQCERCGLFNSNLLAVGNAELSAQYSGLLGVPSSHYDRLCPSCALETIGLSPEHFDQHAQDDSGQADLIKEIQAQMDLMIAVSTGGPRIQEKENEFKERRLSIARKLHALGIDDPNPHVDLWAWYGRWSSGDLSTYQSRRKHVADLYGTLLVQLERRLMSLPSDAVMKPTGWARVDRGIDAIGKRLGTAKNEEEFQTVGLLCRETLISLAQAVFDSSVHQSQDGVTPSPTDANRMMDGYFTKELAGGSNEVARKAAKAALALAVELQHRRTAQFKDAALCAEALRSLVNLVAIISGRRNSIPPTSNHA